MLAGTEGAASQFAMRVIVKLAELAGAAELISIASAHIDGCLFHGYAGLDFAERLVRGGAAVRVPTTLNVSSLDLLHPDRYRGDPETARAARRLMDAYVAMGCRETWTCAPYQLPVRPAFGEHVAWAESNAIVFVNSVLGARTGRYGDFVDICAAITGRVPNAGLHLSKRRRGQVRWCSTCVACRIGCSARTPSTRCSGTSWAPRAAAWCRWWRAWRQGWARTGSRRSAPRPPPRARSPWSTWSAPPRRRRPSPTPCSTTTRSGS